MLYLDYGRKLGIIIKMGINMLNGQKPHYYHTRVDSSGRISLPAEVRASLGVDKGDVLMIVQEGDCVFVRTAQQSWQHAQKLVRQYIPQTIDLAAELIAERRIEAARDHDRP